MPETPMSESAARTSSSLKGLMIAVTSFMGGTLAWRWARAARDAGGVCSFRATEGMHRCRPLHQNCQASAPSWSAPAPARPVLVRTGARCDRLFFAAMYERIVIAGAGQAAVQAIDTLRRRGYTGALAVVGEEPWLPYQRPPLSKKYLAGSVERERLLIRPQPFFADHGVTAHLGRRVAEIAPERRHVRLDDGVVLPFDALLLATGSRP